MSWDRKDLVKICSKKQVEKSDLNNTINSLRVLKDEEENRVVRFRINRHFKE